MALINITEQHLSDLVVNEIDPSVGYARRVVEVNGAGATLKMGSVVFRTIASGAVDQSAPFAPLTTPATQLVAANEFAVVFGDKFGFKDSFVTEGTGNTKAVSFVRGEVILKDKVLLEVNNITRNSAEHKALKALLEKQGIITEEDLAI